MKVSELLQQFDTPELDVMICTGANTQLRYKELYQELYLLSLSQYIT